MMKEICPKNKCTGCFACVTACPHNCIRMQEDEYGELHPIVDEVRCVNCGICERTCPNNKELLFNRPLLCYASWITDNKKRRICASGGIGTILSEYVIKECGGIVFGSRYNDSLTPIMSYTDKLNELEYFKGSRYVQSIVGDETFKNVLLFLKSGRKVLFVGTPCQIAGLKCFLRNDYDNLITVDLICHGCTPTRYFEDELAQICETGKYSNISDIRFRGNDRHNFCFSLWKGNSCVYNKKGSTSYYLAGFLHGVTLRTNCFNCLYARPERISDITIGDFIGIGKKVPFNYSKRNVSCVLINTSKGQKFYEEVATNSSVLMNVEREYEERLDYKPSLVEPFPKHELTDMFRKEYLNGGYKYASRKVLSESVREYEIIERKRNIINIFLLPYRVIRKLYRIMHNCIRRFLNKIAIQ